MVVAQFWAFANDIYTPEQGKRLFPMVGLGSNVGAWLGAVVGRPAHPRIGPVPPDDRGGGMLAVCVVLAGS